jgi:SAM-dependent methyltransferase
MIQVFKNKSASMDSENVAAEKVLLITSRFLSPENIFQSDVCGSSHDLTWVHDDPSGVLFQQLPRLLFGKMSDLEWFLIRKALHQNRARTQRGAQLADLCVIAKKIGYHYILDLRTTNIGFEKYIKEFIQILKNTDILIKYYEFSTHSSYFERCSNFIKSSLDLVCCCLTGLKTHFDPLSIGVNLVRNTDSFLDFCVLASPKSLDDLNYIFFKNERSIVWHKENSENLSDEGKSKTNVLSRFFQILKLVKYAISDPEPFLSPSKSINISTSLIDPQQWSEYWFRNDGGAGIIYGFLAGIFRRHIIKRDLERETRRWFEPGSLLLHAGCGSGQVDVDLQMSNRIVAVDISPEAIFRYSKNVRHAEAVVHASIFELPFPDSHFDGVYNLGVMEHFTESEICAILKEFHRVLKPHGRVLLFWPHRFASSVIFLKVVSAFARFMDKKFKSFHPPEVTRMKSKTWAFDLMRRANFKPISYGFGCQDGFVQTRTIAEKILC